MHTIPQFQIFMFLCFFTLQSQAQDLDIVQYTILEEQDKACFAKADTHTWINLCSIESKDRWEDAEKKLYEQIESTSKGTGLEIFFKDEKTTYISNKQCYYDLIDKVREGMQGSIWGSYFLGLKLNHIKLHYRDLSILLENAVM